MITVLLLSKDISDIKKVSEICQKHNFLFLFVESKEKFIKILSDEKIVVSVINSTFLSNPLNIVENFRNKDCNTSFIYIGEKSFEKCKNLLKNGFYDYLPFNYSESELENVIIDAVENVFTYERIKSISDDLEKSNKKLIKKTKELQKEKNALKNHIKLLRKMQDFVKNVSTLGDIETLIHLSTNWLGDIFKNRVILFSLLEDTKLVIKNSYNIELDHIEKKVFNLKDFSWADKIFEKKQKMIIKNNKLFSFLPYGFVKYPLLSRNKVFGTITVSLNKDEEGDLKEHEPLIFFVAEYASIAIDNIRLFNNLIKTIEDLKATRDKLLEKQSVETIAKFAVSVNHEINNPLCSISLNIEILKKMFYDENNEILCKIFATIEKNIEKITDITAKIQNLKRISTKEYLPGIDMIDLNED